MIYLFGIIKLVDRDFCKVWKLVFLAYIFFIIAKILRVVEIGMLINMKSYAGIVAFAFIVIITLAIINMNKIVKKVCFSKTKPKKR